MSLKRFSGIQLWVKLFSSVSLVHWLIVEVTYCNEGCDQLHQINHVAYQNKVNRVAANTANSNVHLTSYSSAPTHFYLTRCMYVFKLEL